MRSVIVFSIVAILFPGSTVRGAESSDGVHDPANAVANLDVHPDLEATLFASEPMLTNPSNIEIDHRGRVWVCEIVNYRGHRGKRPEGDRILILEDSDGDAKADKQTVFYQQPDFISPHGICVLGTPDGKGTRVIVSVGDKVIVLTDNDGDLKADDEKIMFTGIRGVQHDHGIHAFVFGPDGKLYFNMGNEGRQLKDKDGNPVVDKAGNEVATRREPYQEGLVFRCNLDGSELETLGWNFRNNWEVTVDSFGTIWQSDNDDDGNKGVRINYVMEFGNYGYKDEMTGAGWNTDRTGMHEEVPKRHWHWNDPGVVPTLLLTGAGSPVGITIYEGNLLPEVFRGQMIHCDAGPSVVRAYPVEKDGAGYTAEIVNILEGTRNNWFRPSDVSFAPDGSLIVADWYDPGVGGHNAGDLERGRLFRVTPRGEARQYAAAEFDFASADGCSEALKNPNYAVRYIAWTALHAMGAEAEEALQEMSRDENPCYQARAFWLLSKIKDREMEYVFKAKESENPDIRIVGIRAGRQVDGMDVVDVVRNLTNDSSPEVRRECALALRNSDSSFVPQIWTELARQHDGKDRWYLEALGIAADGRWDACLEQWLLQMGGADEAIKTEAGRDIIWRSRGKQTPALLAKILQSESTPESEKPRYFRAFDFQTGPEKEAALKSLLGL